MTLSELAKLNPPPGWLWDAKPTLRTRGTLVLDAGQAISTKKGLNERVSSLYEWAIKNKVGLTPDGTGAVGTKWFYISYEELLVQTRYKASVNKPEATSVTFGDWKAGCCGRTITPGQTTCPGCGYRVACSGCGISGHKVYQVTSLTRPGRKLALCAVCAPVCVKEGCSIRSYTGEYGTKYGGLCSEHMPVEPCFACHVLYDKTKGKSCIYRGNEAKCCPTCYDKFVCRECTTYASTVSRSTKHLCKACTLATMDVEINKHVTFPKSELPKNGSLVITDLPERPYRIMSIETEVNGDKDVLAGMLYRCGLVAVPEVQGYNTYPNTELPWVAHLKHDGSVTGGELIFHCMNLDTKEHADALLTTLSKLRGMAKADHIKFSKECGGHIHIDAHNFGYGDVWRLLTIWNYLEDVIYRLAGAGHDYGHRTLVNERPMNGIGYALSAVKGPFGSKAVATRSVAGQQRHCGLNFVPYVQSQQDCYCGAFGRGDGDGRDCTCNLGKRTIEWRVWNTQGNPRILHAWLAFMQAVHAYCDTGEDPTPDWEKEFPALPFTFKKYNDKTDKSTKERLEWIFRNLVLTNDERDSLVYAFKQSELSVLGETYLNSLLQIVPVNAFPVKQRVKHFAKRKVAMKVTPPSESKKAKAVASVVSRGDTQARFIQDFITVNVPGNRR